MIRTPKKTSELKLMKEKGFSQGWKVMVKQNCEKSSSNACDEEKKNSAISIEEVIHQKEGERGSGPEERS